MHGASHQIEVVEGTDGEIDVVESAGLLEERGDLLGVLQAQAAGDHLVGAETDAQGEVGAHRFAHRVDHLEGEAQAVLELPP